MRSRSFRRLVAALAATVLAVACGAPPKTASELPLLRACDLLRAEDADPDGSLGLVPLRSEVDVSIGQNEAKCTFGLPENPPRVVSLDVRRHPSAERALGAQESTEGFLPALSGVANREVPGVGERAVWAGGRIGQLQAVAGAVRLIITVEVGDETARLPHAREIAIRAFAHLDAESASLAASRGAHP